MNMHKYLIQHFYKVAIAIAIVGVTIVLMALSHEGISEKKAISTDDCKTLGNDKRSACFLESIVDILHVSGVTAATDELATLTSEYPTFQADCHAVMHYLGEEAYSLYIDEVPLDISPNITYCTYGFYHGFITEAVNQEGDFSIAREFCSYVNGKLSEAGMESEDECYHGFGHAAIDDHISTPFLTATEITEQGLSLCDELSDTFSQYQDCASGIFNGIANIYMDGSYDWPEISNQDTFALCRGQNNDIKDTCFGYFARVLVTKNSNNLDDALQETMLTKSDVEIGGVIENVASFFMLTKPDKSDFVKEVGICKTLYSPYNLSCIHGLAVGIVQSVSPGSEYNIAKNLCELDTLSNVERERCYQATLQHVKPLVSATEFRSICSITPEELRGLQCGS